MRKFLKLKFIIVFLIYILIFDLLIIKLVFTYINRSIYYQINIKFFFLNLSLNNSLKYF